MSEPERCRHCGAPLPTRVQDRDVKQQFRTADGEFQTVTVQRFSERVALPCTNCPGDYP